MDRRRCSVVGCPDEHACLHVVPASEDTRVKWIDFIYESNVPIRVGKKIFVCANHFELDCFTNLGQYNAGLAGKLILYTGSVPSIRRRKEDEGNASPAVQGARVHMACQTDPLKMCTVATQLSMKTLAPHYKSIGTQKSVRCTDVGVGTSAAAFKAFITSTTKKRPNSSCQKPKSRNEWTSSTLSDARDVEEGEIITSLSVGDGRYLVDLASSSEFIVDEECLLQLFSSCRRCHRQCSVGKRAKGLKLVVNQACGFCESQSEWTNLPDGENNDEDDDNVGSAKL